MVNLFQQAFNGLSSASVYALVAVGLSIVFGLSGIVNLAYGDFLTLGAYVVFVTAAVGGVAFIYGFAIAVLAIGVLCIILERVLFRWTLTRPVNGFLISLGLIQIIENGLQWHYTDNGVTVNPANSTVWNVDGVLMSVDRVIIIVGTAIILVSLIWFLERTRTGLAIRAVATDRETAALMGAPVTKLVTGVFALGGMLAGAGGAFVALLEPPNPQLGAELILKGFVVALVGGLGNVRGALVGALALTVVETSLYIANLSSWLDAIEFGAVIALLLFRPQGLVGGVEHSM